MLRYVKIALVVLLLIVAASFTLMNDQAVMLNYFQGEIELPLAWVVFATLVVGWLIGLLTLSGRLIRMRFRLREAERKADLNATELKNLRSLPLSDNY